MNIIKFKHPQEQKWIGGRVLGSLMIGIPESPEIFYILMPVCNRY